MVIKYIRLKYTVLYKRFKKENSKEERIGVFLGYILILGIVFGIAYSVFCYLFHGNKSTIRAAIFSVYFLVAIISAFGLFDKVHNIFFENKDREILFLLPCKSKEIIAIKYIELLLGFMEGFLLIFFPVASAYLLIDIHFAANFIFLIVSSLAVGLFLVSFIIFVVLLASNLTKGKNTKILSVFLSVGFTALTYGIALFFVDDLEKKIDTSFFTIVFFPFIKIANAIFTDRISNLLINVLLSYIYIIPILIGTVFYFGYSIKQGFLYYQHKNNSKTFMIRKFLGTTMGNKIAQFGKSSKDAGKFIECIVKKDLISLLNTYDFLKVIGQVLFISIIMTIRLDLERNGIGLWVLLTIKSIFLAFLFSNYLYEYEWKKIQLLVLAGVPNNLIVKGKNNALNIVNISGILIIDICLFTVNKSSLISGITGCIIDAGGMVLANCLASIIAFLGMSLNENEVVIGFKYKVLNFIGITLIMSLVGGIYIWLRDYCPISRMVILTSVLEVLVLLMVILLGEKVISNMFDKILQYKQVCFQLKEK